MKLTGRLSLLAVLFASSLSFALAPQARADETVQKGTIGLVCTTIEGETFTWNGAKIPGLDTPANAQTNPPTGFRDCLQQVVRNWQQQHAPSGGGTTPPDDGGASSPYTGQTGQVPVPTADDLIGGYGMLRNVLDAQIRR
jgi:hypothetical protein